VFKFGEARKAMWRFSLPEYLRDVKDVFRLDADGLYDTKWSIKDGAVEIKEKTSRVAIYVATPDPLLRGAIEKQRQGLITAEDALEFDPARNDADFERLVQLSESLI
jgi:hypothetical protein